MELADWTEVLLFLIGTILVVADLFFVAGFGVLAIPGLVLMIAGLFLSLMGRPELWTWESVGMGARPLLLSFLTTVLIAGLMLKMLPRTSAWKWLVLHEEERSDAGYIATGKHDVLLGKEGINLSM